MNVRPIACTGLVLGCAAAGWAVTGYTATDVGVLPGHAASLVRGVNAAGHAAGESRQVLMGADGAKRAVLYDGSALQPLATLGGASQGNAINDSDQVVGSSVDSRGYTRAVLWSGGSVVTLTPKNVGWSAANAISSASPPHMVGKMSAPKGEHAFLWRNGALTDLGVLTGGKYSHATDVNLQGLIVGASTTGTSNGSTLPVVWEGTAPTALPLLDGGTGGIARSVNDLGQVVGFANVGTTSHACLWQKVGGAWTVQDLGAPMDALAINNAGDVVGYAQAESGEWRYFRWTSAGGIEDLSALMATSGWTISLSSPGLCLNESGTIGGFGVGPSTGGNTHGALLTPY